MGDRLNRTEYRCIPVVDLIWKHVGGSGHAASVSAFWPNTPLTTTWKCTIQSFAPNDSVKVCFVNKKKKYIIKYLHLHFDLLDGLKETTTNK